MDVYNKGSHITLASFAYRLFLFDGMISAEFNHYITAQVQLCAFIMVVINTRRLNQLKRFVTILLVGLLFRSSTVWGEKRIPIIAVQPIITVLLAIFHATHPDV